LPLGCFFENHIGTDDSQRRNVRRRFLICVVLGKAEKLMPYEELVGTEECVTL